MISFLSQHLCSGKSTSWAQLVTSHWADLETINFDIGSRLECLYLILLLHWFVADTADSPTTICLFTVRNSSPVQRWVICLVSFERLLERRAHRGAVGVANNIDLFPDLGL